VPGASQDALVLVGRLIEDAKSLGISDKDMQDEVGDLNEYVRDKLREVNQSESDRPK
jgi:hypothetical protein